MQNGKVRSISLVEAFKVSKPTVSNIVKRLVSEGFITIDEKYIIELTEKGLAVAEEVSERNHVIRDLLIGLGVERSVAEADACEMEHVISRQSFEALKALAKH